VSQKRGPSRTVTFTALLQVTSGTQVLFEDDLGVDIHAVVVVLGSAAQRIMEGVALGSEVDNPGLHEFMLAPYPAWSC
jgi:predicted RecA/RadA family phage recombinase